MSLDPPHDGAIGVRNAGSIRCRETVERRQNWTRQPAK